MQMHVEFGGDITIERRIHILHVMSSGVFVFGVGDGVWFVEAATTCRHRHRSLAETYHCLSLPKGRSH